MAAGFVDITVTTKTGIDVTFHCWVPDTGSPTVGAIPLRMATDSSGAPIDATHPMFAQLIASTAAIGKLAANAGVNIGTVTVDPTQVTGSQSTDFLKAIGVVPVGFATDQAPLTTKGNTVTQAASSTITRPSDSNAYASGDLLANSVTAASVLNLQFTTLARVSGGSGLIVGAQIQKTNVDVANAAFRLHLFSVAPTYTSAGDNSPLSTVVVASGKGYLGYIDITTMVAFSDVAWGSGAPDNTRGSIPFVAAAQIIYGIVEVRGAYAGHSAEVFTVTLDALQD